MIPRKRNIAGYIDEQGRFRPIRKPSFVGSQRRKAKTSDRKKYSRAKAGDLGKRRQMLAREDVFDREIRLEAERKQKAKRELDREWSRIERESLGEHDTTTRGRTLLQFVRAEGGIKPSYKFGGKKYRGKKQSYDFGELEPFTLKQSGKRGLVSEKGKKSLDGMFQAAKESGYAVSDPWDLLDKMDDEIKNGKALYANYGFLDYRDNPAGGKSDLYIAQLGPRSFGVFLKTYLLQKFPTKAAAELHLRSIRTRAKVKANPSAVKAAKAAISIFDNDLDLDVDEKDLRRLQAATRKLASRRKNGGRSLKRNPVGWFRDVSPVTPDAVKKLYRTLAAKYHPDKGGDTRTMQEINADYSKAMKIAISGEGNEARAKAETAAVEPLREAIEFAVTLPDDVKVVIRGLWLWIEGNTYKSKDLIKSFKSSDGNRFKWASQKKAWFFAAVPSSNRRGEMSFAEIEALHGRQDVTERKRRQALNPADPLTTFAMAAGGIASALQIKQMLASDDHAAKPKRRGTKTAQLAKRAKNPAGATSGAKYNEKLFDRDLAEIEDGNMRKVRSAIAHGRLAGYSKEEVDWLINRAKLASRLKVKLNPADLKREMRTALKYRSRAAAPKTQARASKKNPIKVKLWKFYKGQKLATRMTGDADIAMRGTVVSRTPKFVTVQMEGERKTRRCGVGVWGDSEVIFPDGKYSMATPFHAKDDDVSRRRNPKANPERCLKCRKMTAEGVIDLNGGLCDRCETIRQATAKSKAVKDRDTIVWENTNARGLKSYGFNFHAPGHSFKVGKAVKGHSGNAREAGYTSKVLAVLRGGKKAVVRSKKANPVKPPRSRLFETFQGRKVTTATRRPVSVHAPAKLTQLGDLIELRVKGVGTVKVNPKTFKLTASGGRLWIVGGKIAKPNPAGKANEINPIGELTHVVYGTRKPHHGDHSYTHYIHAMGEDSGRRPLLCADRDGYPVLRGGNYKIEARGIVD